MADAPKANPFAGGGPRPTQSQYARQPSGAAAAAAAQQPNRPWAAAGRGQQPGFPTQRPGFGGAQQQPPA